MEETPRALPLVPSLVIALDDVGERVAERVWERIATDAARRQRIAFLRWRLQTAEGSSSTLEGRFLGRIGPSRGILSGGPTSGASGPRATK